MAIRLAINGFGRIGRCVVRAIVENQLGKEFDLVAVNDLTDTATNAHLLRYDSVHGTFNASVETDGTDLIVNGDRLRILSEREPEKLPWKELDIDLVMDCTGRFRTAESAGKHLQAGAKKVLLSAPSGDMKMVVYGVNHHVIEPGDTLVSNASCTTNCLAPLVKVIDDAFGVESGLMNTIHSYTNDQSLLDRAHKDLRRARAGALSMIPTKTGASSAVGKVLPHLEGKLDGFAIRVPTPNVSMVDITFLVSKATDVESVKTALREAVKGPIGEVLNVTDEPLVSSDYVHHPASSICDLDLTRVSVDGRQVKLCSWYDNEWGYSNRMLDTARIMMGA